MQAAGSPSTMSASDPQADLYVARLHWIIFVWPVVLFVVGAYAGLHVWQLKEVSLLLITCSAIWLLVAWITYHYSSLTIRSHQVILRTGFLVRQTIDVPMAKIESIDIRQTVGGTILGYGTLMITGTGGSRNSMNFVSHPLTCRRYMEQRIHV